MSGNKREQRCATFGHNLSECMSQMFKEYKHTNDAHNVIWLLHQCIDELRRNKLSSDKEDELDLNHIAC